MARRFSEVRRERAQGSGVSVAEGVDGVEFAIVIGQTLGHRIGIQTTQITLGLQGRKNTHQGAGNILRRPVGDHKAGAILGHQSDVFAEFARPRVDFAEDATMRLPQAANVEGAGDGILLEIDEIHGDCIGFEPIKIRLVAEVFQVDEDIRAGVDIRIARGLAHATAGTFT